jgi:hypothetical protein
MTRRICRTVAIGLALLAGAGCDVSDLPKAPRTLTVAVPRDLATLDPATGAWTEPAWTAPLTWGAFGLAWAAERGRGLLRPGPAAGA